MPPLLLLNHPILRKRLSRQKRLAANQNEVNADIERRRGLGKLDRVVKGVTIRHEGGGGQDAVSVGFDDAGVHIASEAEIIRIDDQAFQKSLS